MNAKRNLNKLSDTNFKESKESKEITAPITASNKKQLPAAVAKESTTSSSRGLSTGALSTAGSTVSSGKNLYFFSIFFKFIKYLMRLLEFIFYVDHSLTNLITKKICQSR